LQSQPPVSKTGRLLLTLHPDNKFFLTHKIADS
jgi:hypothetical protein